MNPSQQLDEFINEFWAGDSEKRKKIIKERNEVIKGGAEKARIILRQGLPISVRLDQATDEFHFLAGAKRVVIWVGSGAGFVGLCVKGFRLVFG